MLEGEPSFSIEGIPAALVGHHCSCPRDGHDHCVIVDGDPNFQIAGRAVAVEGSHTSCGAVLLACQDYPFTVGPWGGAGEVATASAASGVMDMAGALQAVAPASQKALTLAEPGADPNSFDRKLQLADLENGIAHINQRYRITTSRGVFEGVTDAEGITQNVSTGSAIDDLHVILLGD